MYNEPSKCPRCGYRINVFVSGDEYRCGICGWLDEEKTKLSRMSTHFKGREVEYIEDIINTKVKNRLEKQDKIIK